MPLLKTRSHTHDDLYAQWDALLPQDQPLTPAPLEPDFECRICQEPPTDPCVTRCGHLYCLNCLRQWLDFSPKCPTCKSLSSMQDVVPIYRDDSSCASGPSSPEMTTSRSTSTRSSVSYSQRLLSPPPNANILRDDAQIAPSALLAAAWSGATQQQPAAASKRTANWRQRSAYSTSTSSPATSLLPLPDLPPTAKQLAPAPPRFRFTLEEPAPVQQQQQPEDDNEWDTDDEMEFQLNQIASIKVPQTITDAVNADVYQGQPVRRALSVVGLAIFLTVLLK